MHKFDRNLIIRMEFTPGTLMMRRQHVVNMLHERVVGAFMKAQELLLEKEEYPEVNITVKIEPEE